MIKIDGKTSVLYDNAKYAQVIKTQATVTGSADLSSGITIKKDVNDTLKEFEKFLILSTLLSP